MPCSSGSYGPPQTPPVQEETKTLTSSSSGERASPDAEQNPSDGTEEVQDDCCQPKDDKCGDKDGCCGTNTDSDSEPANCCAPSPKESIDEGCAKPCCSTEKTKQLPTKDNGCCGPKSPSQPADNCCGPPANNTTPQHGCTTPSVSTVKLDKAPSCCEGKPSPCCDSACIDRLALRECASGKPAPSSYSGSSSECTHGAGGQPCRRHNRSVREYYQAKLDALGCICRALLAMGQESCCVTKDKPSVERKRSSRKSSPQRAVIDSCCATGTSTCASGSARPRSKKGCGAASPQPEEESCGKGCCSSAPVTTKPVACSDGCCDESPVPSAAGSCADVCCSEKKPAAIREVVREVEQQTGDLEQGMTDKEHVILSISGMTCTGCETNLRRTLGTLPAVKNLKTSLVLARAEFDIDGSRTSAETVIKHLERTTEFKCERVKNEGSRMDLICNSDPLHFVNGSWPDGVVDIRVVGTKVIRVDYDAERVGARDLLEKGWDEPMKLAEPTGDPTLGTGAKHVRHVGYMTLLSAALTIPVLVLAWAPLPDREI